MQERQKYLNPKLAINYKENPLKVAWAKGTVIVEQNGQKNLDCINNVTILGHSHPEMVRRVSRQLETVNTNSRFIYDSLHEAIRRLREKLPAELSCITFVNSGSEANDLALQMAGLAAGRGGVACLEGGYHGITKATMEVSPYKWNANYPCPPHVVVGPSPCTYRGPHRHQPIAAYLEAFAQVLREDTGTFISELMQSCAGQVVPPLPFYQALYGMLAERGIVTICDEVQTGFARLGKAYWAFEYYGVLPDIVTIGKAMGNGFPVSAVVCKPHVAEAFRRQGIELFSTYGGSPLSTTAVSVVMEVIDREGLLGNAEQVGEHLGARLRELLGHPCVGDVRGVGLFQGIELVTEKDSRTPNPGLASAVKAQARRRGVLLSVDGVHENIIKVKPPLCFSRRDADLLVDTVARILQEHR